MNREECAFNIYQRTGAALSQLIDLDAITLLDTLPILMIQIIKALKILIKK